MQYLATFFTHCGAVKYQNHLKKQSIPVELMPVPRKLSSSCGIAAQFAYSGDIRSMISEDIESLFEIEGTEHKLIYKNV
ncbi:MAG: DUF3343 domain-containing protein [Clostridiaceae bacterium]|jgi:hypothetical protein|nr:DUF3343 domain-containing protein [Clostridiaceae bacterium]